MPNYTTHLAFGRQVYALLPATAQAALPLAPFDCGQFGSDPLFFYPIPGRSAVSKEGHALHHTSAHPVLERLRRGGSAAHAYAAGYLCHFLLDAACHPYVYQTASRHGISHMAMEGEFDRYLREQLQTPLPPIWPQSREVIQAAALAYETADDTQFSRALWEFARFSALIERLSGTVRGRAVNLFTRNSLWSRGLVLTPLPHPMAAQTNAALLSRFQDAVIPAADLVQRLLRAYATGAPLDFVPACDHAGRPLDP